MDLATKVAHQRLTDDASLPRRTSLTPDDIIILLEFCLNATYFAFCNFFYQQVHGTAMHGFAGFSSCSRHNIVMEDVESTALNTYPSHSMQFPAT